MFLLLRVPVRVGRYAVKLKLSCRGGKVEVYPDAII